MSISVICVYNNEEQLNDQLKASLAEQDIEHELIAINNANGTFHSAAAALNYGARKATGDILIFSHQDIFLKTADGLRTIADAISQCEKGTIIGTQGVREPSKRYYENLTAGQEFASALIEQYPMELYEVSCVDEGMFGMKRITWKEHPFDEVLCDNWHLYAVEACLWARKNKHSVYVFPVELHHFSRGKISLGYMQNLKRLCKVYRKDFRYIWTTCYKVRTNALYINALVALWCLNRLRKRLMKK